jgi:zinc transporter
MTGGGSAANLALCEGFGKCREEVRLGRDTMTDDDGLICAYLLDGRGGAREMGWPEVGAWKAEDGILWLHLDRTGTVSHTWLKEKSGLDLTTVEALLAEETRPRSLATRDGLLAILRGVNLNPGADPEDMVALRIHVEDHRVITVRARKVMAVNDLREQLAAGRGPKGPGDFLVRVAGRLVDRMGSVVDDISDVVDAVEDDLLTNESREIRYKLRTLRQQAIRLRRHLAPQRDALARVQFEEFTWHCHVDSWLATTLAIH